MGQGDGYLVWFVHGTNCCILLGLCPKQPDGGQPSLLKCCLLSLFLSPGSPSTARCLCPHTLFTFLNPYHLQPLCGLQPCRSGCLGGYLADQLCDFVTTANAALLGWWGPKETVWPEPAQYLAACYRSCSNLVSHEPWSSCLCCSQVDPAWSVARFMHGYKLQHLVSATEDAEFLLEWDPAGDVTGEVPGRSC